MTLFSAMALINTVSCSSSSTNKSGANAMTDNSIDKATTQEEVAAQEWYDPAKKLNHLVGESSPYLLMHADNPVNWYPWGEEALQRARDENKPIFLSVGYASCHWCHVMEHESFVDDSVADYLNEHFISIKVDREQRPDIDQIYMTAVQVFTRGAGGWPMSVFMTPDLKPFFAGTYFPRDDAYGRPGFLTLLGNLNKVFVENRGEVDQQAEKLTKLVKQQLQLSSERVSLGKGIFEQAIEQSLSHVDYTFGGFGTDKKFPHASELAALLRYYVLNKSTLAESDSKGNSTIEIETQNKKTLQAAEAVNKTLTGMMSHGMYDQIGGGFHRYTVDRQWAVPHFEKMLYDNSLLVPVYLDASLVFNSVDYLNAAVETLDFMRREMSDPAGGFYSALDADSDGEEGKFYSWLKQDVDALLGSDADFYYQYYVVTNSGNFEHGTNVLARNERAFEELSGATEETSIRKRLTNLNSKLFAARSPRIRPMTDDKVITGWNGMALTAFAKGYQISGEERFLESARRLGHFLKETMYDGKVLRHTYRKGAFSKGQFLEDYGYVANGMVDLYEADGDYQWLEFATTLIHSSLKLFSDETGALYISPAGNDDHLVRPSDVFDGSYPAPGSALLQAAQRVAAVTDDKEISGRVKLSLESLGVSIKRSPVGMMSALMVLHNEFIPRAEFAIVGEKQGRDLFLKTIYGQYFPYRIIATSESADDRVALLRDRVVLSGSESGATGYVCQNYACQLPTSDPQEFAKQVQALQGTNH